MSLAGSSAIKDTSQTRTLPNPPNTDAVVSVTGLFCYAMSTLQVLETGLRRVMQWHARRRSRHPLSEVRRRRATYRAPGVWRWRRSRTLADFREGEEYKHLTHFVHQRVRIVLAPAGSPGSVCRRVSADYMTHRNCKAAAAGRLQPHPSFSLPTGSEQGRAGRERKNF